MSLEYLLDRRQWGCLPQILKLVVFAVLAVAWLLHEQSQARQFDRLYYEVHVNRLLKDEALLEAHGLPRSLRDKRVVAVHEDELLGRVTTYYFFLENGVSVSIRHPTDLGLPEFPAGGGGFGESYGVTEFSLPKAQ